MVLPGTSSRKPPKAFWLISALLVGLFWGLQALRHTLLHSAGGDLGIYDQVAWQMSQGLEPRSTLLGLHHMGNHGAWMFYAIAPLYRLAPSVQWLFFTQALGLILTAWPLWHLGAQAGLKPREQWLICGLWWLQPVVFNTSFVVDFRPETWAMPLLALAIWANRAERRWLWLLCLFAMMGCRDGLGLIVIGLALEQACRRRWRWAAEALLLGGGLAVAVDQGSLSGFEQRHWPSSPWALSAPWRWCWRHFSECTVQPGGVSWGLGLGEHSLLSVPAQSALGFLLAPLFPSFADGNTTLADGQWALLMGVAARCGPSL
ncbi:MAG: DUF2079 domain-containing protein [Synechococcus sp. SB0662_bin_45]|nr:DUF2079 domain-containing protein [Synechococcus sp. SB0668_bin_13]MYE22280.1 DUF2079 domain-containing protein [Synechococcus sp. SB0662_bin_45]